MGGLQAITRHCVFYSVIPEVEIMGTCAPILLNVEVSIHYTGIGEGSH